MKKFPLLKTNNSYVNRNLFSYRFFKKNIKELDSPYLSDETIDEWYIIFNEKKYLNVSDFFNNEIAQYPIF